MTYKIPAHLEGDSIVLDAPPPPDLKHAKITVLFEEPHQEPRPDEIAQSQSAFISDILLNDQEEIWNND